MRATRSNIVKKRPAHAARTASRQRSSCAPPGEIKRLVEKLSVEDLKLSLPLLNAAVSGVILGFNPEDAQMRRLAARSWKRIKPLLSRHLMSEDENVIPWAQTRREFSRAKVEKFKKRHEELRSLVRTINTVDFEAGERTDVSRAGKALCRLAVRLDDLIEGEERELFPMLRRFLTVQEQPLEESSGC